MSAPLAGLLAIFLISPVAAAPADTDLIVQVEVGFPALDRQLVDPSAFPVQVEPGETVELVIRVFDSDDPDTPVTVEDSSKLVEIRDSSGANSAVRFADLTEQGPGVYTTTHTFSDTGEFLLVIQPGVEDRASLHPESTDQVRFIVGGGVPPPPDDSNDMGVIVPVLLVLLVVALVLMATRKRPGRRYEKKAPSRADVDRDSWWWSG